MLAHLHTHLNLINHLHLPMSIKEIPGKDEQVKLHQKEAIGQLQNMEPSTVKMNLSFKIINDRGRGRKR